MAGRYPPRQAQTTVESDVSFEVSSPWPITVPITSQLLPAVELEQLELVDINPVDVSSLGWLVKMIIRRRTYVDSDPSRHVTHLRQIFAIHKHVGTASGAKLVGHPLLAVLVILQLVLTVDFEIIFPHIHVQQAPGRAGCAITDAHWIVFERGHGYTKADGFAMTGSCVSCGSGIWEEHVLMHDSVGVRLGLERFVEGALRYGEQLEASQAL